jgi:AcrR family transcriptional regulator
VTPAARPAAGDPRRRQPRRELILAEAMDLFRLHGYQATGMDEIGAAAGITGPGVYRHFKSKEEILATGLKRAVAGVLERSRAAVAGAGSPRAALEGLVASLVDGLLADRWLSAVFMRERRALSPSARRWVERAERLHVEEWVGALRKVRPELSEGEARLMAHAALWTCLCVAYYDSHLDPARESAILTRMVCAGLLEQAPLSAG